MDKKVQHTLQAALSAFNRMSSHPVTGFSGKIEGVFNSNMQFMDKVDAMDKLFDDEPRMESLREVFFDLLMINFFSEDVRKLEEDYLESKEWEMIEEDTIDRGTELLNLLLYIKECEDEKIEPELNDFLQEFLLVDDDEFQDEHRIYEQIISNQVLLETSYEDISKTAQRLDESSEIRDIFYPVMSFFFEPDPSVQQFDEYVQYSIEKDYDAAVYAILTNYNKPV